MKNNKGREERIEIFQDTINKIHQNRTIFESCEYSKANTKLINIHEDLNKKTPNKKGEIIVVNDRTFHSCMNEKGKIGVLNFASATTPGGGVVRGSNAQEECLCRCSTLYPCLNQEKFQEEFYIYHRELKDVFYDDLMLYTKDVLIFKTDTNFPEMLDEKYWEKVDVITSAAPNLRNIEHPDIDSLKEILYKRIKKILVLGIQNDIEVFVLGAFGCGAFRNPPEIVSNIFHQLLIKENYKCYFDKIIFAVYGIPNKDIHNYEVFSKTFEI